MKVTRLYTGKDGESHFEDMEVPMKDTGRKERVTDLIKTSGMIMRETESSFLVDWHPAPRRQYVLTLSGSVEIEVGDGTRRRFGPGDIMLAEDTTGRGHISRAVGNKPRVSIFVTLE